MSDRLKIVYKPISELREYDNNPRRNDDAVQYVANSIREFGFRVPVIIDSNSIIVAGHTRVKACYQLGITEVPCLIADDLTEEQIRAFRLADNKTAEIADWDYEKLADEMADILNIDMSDFGFVGESAFDPLNFLDSFTGDEALENERMSDVFALTLYLPLELKDAVREWCKENGKESLVQCVIEHIGLDDADEGEGAEGCRCPNAVRNAICATFPYASTHTRAVHIFVHTVLSHGRTRAICRTSPKPKVQRH